MKLIDPEFMQRQSDKAKERYHRKKNMAIDLLPNIEF
jgi:hypothetical protein